MPPADAGDSSPLSPPADAGDPSPLSPPAFGALPGSCSTAPCLGDRVAQCLFSVFARDIPRRGKPDEATGEWTVLAGFALEEVPPDQDAQAHAQNEGESSNRRSREEQNGGGRGRKSLPQREDERLRSSFAPEDETCLSSASDAGEEKTALVAVNHLQQLPSCSRSSPSFSPSNSSVFHPLVVATGSRCIGRCRLVPPAHMPSQGDEKARPHWKHGSADLKTVCASESLPRKSACGHASNGDVASIPPVSSFSSPNASLGEPTEPGVHAQAEQPESAEDHTTTPSKKTRRASSPSDGGDRLVPFHAGPGTAMIPETEQPAGDSSPSSKTPMATERADENATGKRGAGTKRASEAQPSQPSPSPRLSCSPCSGSSSSACASSSSASASLSGSASRSESAARSACSGGQQRPGCVDGSASVPREHRKRTHGCAVPPPDTLAGDDANPGTEIEAETEASLSSPVPPEVYRQWMQGSCVSVHDSHAEVLARRSLKRYLVLGMLSQLHAFLSEVRERTLQVDAFLTRLLRRDRDARARGPQQNRGNATAKVQEETQKFLEEGEHAMCTRTNSQGERPSGGEAQQVQELDKTEDGANRVANENLNTHAEDERRLVDDFPAAVHALSLLLLHPFPSSLALLSPSHSVFSLPLPGTGEPDRSPEVCSGAKSWIELVPLALRFRTRKGMRLHFYASMAPCGDAAVAPRDEEQESKDAGDKGREGQNAEAKGEGEERGEKSGAIHGRPQAVGKGPHDERNAARSAEANAAGHATEAAKRAGGEEGSGGCPGEFQGPGKGGRNQCVASRGKENEEGDTLPVRDSGSEKLCEARKVNEQRGQSPSVPFRFRPTGAKPVSAEERVDEKTSLQTSGKDLLSVQKRGLLRFKPGRSDLPSHLRSLSLSCSDKIWSWNCLGWGGAVLSTCLTSPLFPFAITIGEPSVSLSALESSLLFRHAWDNDVGRGHAAEPQASLDQPFPHSQRYCLHRRDVPRLVKTTAATLFSASREAAERRRLVTTGERLAVSPEARQQAVREEKRESAGKNASLAGNRHGNNLGKETIGERRLTHELERHEAEARNGEGRQGDGSTSMRDRSGFLGHTPPADSKVEVALENPEGRAAPSKGLSSAASCSKKQRKTKEWEGKCSLPPVRSSGLSIAWHRPPSSEFPRRYEALLSLASRPTGAGLSEDASASVESHRMPAKPRVDLRPKRVFQGDAEAREREHARGQNRSQRSCTRAKALCETGSCEQVRTSSSRSPVAPELASDVAVDCVSPDKRAGAGDKKISLSPPASHAGCLTPHALPGSENGTGVAESTGGWEASDREAERDTPVCVCRAASLKAFHEVTVGRSGLLHRSVQKRAANCSYFHSDLCKANLARMYLHLTRLRTEDLPKLLGTALAALATAVEELEHCTSLFATRNVVETGRKVLDEARRRGLGSQGLEHAPFGRTVAATQEKRLPSVAEGAESSAITYGSLKALSVEYQKRKGEWRACDGGWQRKGPSFQLPMPRADSTADPLDFIVENFCLDPPTRLTDGFGNAQRTQRHASAETETQCHARG
ncbi:conserved hypothetical protein [Neospora caninum Liverpool]|uniref:tRNA-specific adenosine deaminase 1 n=1 Tax=Neospora caninum (strain Liverpool) TaxID=572307 RepID=F0VEJ0_NEOCL|nr:conserved hypothetical protein [Neospora caninum Liverpool]CBZ52134.1 conserved hypothetical protein [Neospora caninum Liverpool]CEL66096.1 TPA: tRNA-specific adenosine deaminase 1 [Neospora caninum Liverpool]|eukprot:XP_003882166.1 conserved hypothetical protein [Neospora caninum Liverpool]